MPLNVQQRPVPERLEAPRFVLRRQRLSDNRVDYEAVMDSKPILREWSDSPWPEDEFSLQQNLEDIAGHIGDFEQGLAYGFSLFTPSEERFLGSLYIEEVAPFLESYDADEETRARLETFDARVEYWLRRGVDESFEAELLREVLAWLERDWGFRRVVFGSRLEMAARRAFYRREGLVEVARLVSKDGAREFTFHAAKQQEFAEESL